MFKLFFRDDQEELPQKLGLDVVVNKNSGELVTLEINGEMSGYKGLLKHGRDVSRKILDKLGDRCKKSRILVSPYMIEFSTPLEIMNPKYLQCFYRIKTEYTPRFTEGRRISVDELEYLFGKLSSFKAILGLADKLVLPEDKERSYNITKKMINCPGLELITRNKLAQYVYLKDVPELNMPETIVLDVGVNKDEFIGLVQKYGKVVRKLNDSNQGIGVLILDESSAISFLEMMVSAELSELIDGEDAINDRGIQDITLRYNSGTLDRDHDPVKQLKRRIMTHGLLLQRYVDTLPVRSNETGQPHYARARLLWFGEYIGGYWGLSKDPIEGSDNDNQIVNYCRTGRSELFTPEEETIFKEYAEKVVPEILKRTQKLSSDAVYNRILTAKYLKALRGEPDLF